MLTVPETDALGNVPMFTVPLTDVFGIVPTFTVPETDWLPGNVTEIAGILDTITNGSIAEPAVILERAVRTDCAASKKS